MQERWAAVDRYITDLFVQPDPALDAAIEASDAAGLPSIHVAPNQGKLLHLLARVRGARSILEIGSGDRHARRLQHDLACPRAPGRRAAHYA